MDRGAVPCRATRSGYPPALPLGLGVHLGENARSKLAPGSGVEKVFVVVRPQADRRCTRVRFPPTPRILEFMPWETSDRRKRLPGNWGTIRKRILQRDGYRCQWPGCRVRATDVDHVIPDDDDSDANLASLCANHHAQKSSREGAAASNNAQRIERARRFRTPELHPLEIERQSDEGSTAGPSRPERYRNGNGRDQARGRMADLPWRGRTR